MGPYTVVVYIINGPISKLWLISINGPIWLFLSLGPFCTWVVLGFKALSCVIRWKKGFFIGCDDADLNLIKVCYIMISM